MQKCQKVSIWYISNWGNSAAEIIRQLEIGEENV